MAAGVTIMDYLDVTSYISEEMCQRFEEAATILFLTEECYHSEV
jgi:hypothetical protein